MTWLGLAASTMLCGCRTAPKPGTAVARAGDEIVVAGRFIHTGTPVVTWMEPGGYDAYRVERRFSSMASADWDSSHAEVEALKTPNRYGLRREPLTAEQVEVVRGGGWEPALLTNVVDQFVIHYDGCGTSRQCFQVLHDQRGLSVHFLLDLDGTIYQTLDLKERAWHATTSNTRSIGIEIAQIGAFTPDAAGALDRWYAADADGRVRITLPAHLGDGGIRTRNFVGRPARASRIEGAVQRTSLVQYDFTPEQYRALIRLTATLCRVFPKLRCDYPRDAAGHLVRERLEPEELATFTGILGHWHVQANKVDPGPAFQWDRLVTGVRELLTVTTPRRFESPKGASLR